MNTNTLNIFVAGIWILNGLFCKILNFVPRHEQIVSQIFNTNHSRLITVIIGFAETGLALWILCGLKRQQSAIFQIIAVTGMNILEFILVPDLLLWGKFNLIFALLFTMVVYFNGFYFNKIHHD